MKELLKKERIDILITHFTDPRDYPTEINTLRIFKENNIKFKEICIKEEKVREEVDFDFIFVGKRNNRFYYLYLYPLFCLIIFLFGMIKRPKVIIAYDLLAFFPSFIVSKFFNIPFLYHIHDIGEKNNAGFLGKMIFSFEMKFIKYIDILSMPSDKIFNLYEVGRKLPEKKFTVINTVSKYQNLNYPSRIKEIIKKYKNIKKWIVRTGGLGDDQCIKEIILSLIYLPEDIGLILAGSIEDDFKEEIENLIKEKKLEKRVILLEFIPRKEVLGFLKNAFVGISLYKPVHINWLYPAPIKLSEYIATGIPAIVNDNEYFRVLNEKVGSFLFADPYSPKSIADAIMKIYKDKKLEKRLKENAKNSFKEFYNFEHQFEPVLKEIKRWIER